MRTCIGCRRAQAADRLVRLCRQADGTVGIGRHLPGRGAWLCAGDPRCWDHAVRRRAFATAFGVPVPQEAIDDLRRRMVASGYYREARGVEEGGSVMWEDGGPGGPKGGRTPKGH